MREKIKDIKLETIDKDNYLIVATKIKKNIFGCVTNIEKVYLNPFFRWDCEVHSHKMRDKKEASTICSVMYILNIQRVF